MGYVLDGRRAVACACPWPGSVRTRQTSFILSQRNTLNLIGGSQGAGQAEPWARRIANRPIKSRMRRAGEGSTTANWTSSPLISYYNAGFRLYCFEQ